ncbi:TRAP transporter large permease [Variovorax paradoxus]|nr:TRAP transporter large permease [Variovorax paradoxus]MBT2301894.1 TRAP transporter large permease [Variovorax paradoxus]
MTPAILGFLAVFVLAGIGIPLALSMGLAGMVGMGLLLGWPQAFASVTQTLFETGFAYQLSVVPLFVLMGSFVLRAGMARELFTSAQSFVGHLRGGLAMATIIACGGFGAICGSSVATAATMTRVAYPEMRRHGYSEQLAAGVVAAGGTLGILIPPSTLMVIYGITTETNIGKLFVAGILPGIVAIALLCVAVRWISARNPAAAPAIASVPWKQRVQSLRSIWGVMALFALVIGGIYGGYFTATEGAGVGACGAFGFALLRGSLNLKVLSQVLSESARTTAMLFTIIIAAGIFSNFINFTALPGELKALVLQFNPHPILVIVAMMVIYVVLGTVMEELSMILLTLPVFFPIVTSLGFDPVWFGVLIVCIVEIGMISPPVGMNLFVVKSYLPQVPLRSVFRGVAPFVAADVIRLGILIALPIISLWLPSFMA